MVPATEAIMGSLSPEKAGIGSAMNDVVREAGGTLGVAVLGSVGAAHAVADQLGGETGALIAAAFLPARAQADGRASAHSRRRGESTGAAESTSTTTSTGTSARLAAATIASGEGAS
jgi:hypothetical protein